MPSSKPKSDWSWASKSMWFAGVALVAVVLVVAFLPRKSPTERGAAPDSPRTAQRQQPSPAVPPPANSESVGAATTPAEQSAEVAASTPAPTDGTNGSVASDKTLPPLRAANGGDGWALAPPPPTKARVSLGKGLVDPINVGGHYQRLTLPSGAEARITVEVPSDDPSRQLLVRAIQGGTINDAENFAVFDLQSGARDISFTFRAGTDPGLSEVILRRGTTEEVLQFWTPTASPQYDPPSLSID